MKVNACFFDLDNTLYDYDAAHARHAAARFARRRSRPATAFGDAQAKAGSGFQCNTQSRRRSSSISFSSPRKASARAK